MKNLPARKNNRIKNYDYSQGGAYFITICTKNMACILSSIVGVDAHIDPQIKLTEYGKVVKAHLEKIDGITDYVIMPNHIHLIIVKNGSMWASTPTSISTDIRSFKTMVTKRIGEQIWQRSFYDHIIRDEEDLYYHLQYIEENPKKWTMGKDEYYA